MMVSRAVSRNSLSGGRWLLPWFGVLLVSIALACAVTSAMTRLWSPADWPAWTDSGALANGEIQLTQATDNKAAAHACGSHSTYFGGLGWLIYDTARGSTCE